MNQSRSQADRDAMTVEIGFALLTAAVFAAAAYLAVTACLFAAGVHDQPVAGMLAKVSAVTVFIARVLQVLLPAAESHPEPDESPEAYGPDERHGP